MNMGTVWTVLGVVVAIIIAIFLVNILFAVLAWIFKVIIVLAVAALVFAVLRSVFSKQG